MNQNTKYYFDMVINSLQGDYNVYVEAKDNNRESI